MSPCVIDRICYSVCYVLHEFIIDKILYKFKNTFIQQGITVKPVVNALKVKRQSEEESTLNEKIHETVSIL